MDRSMLVEMHGKNVKGEPQNNAAPKDQTGAPIGRLQVDQCYIQVTLTRRDFASLSLLPRFRWITMVQCAKCSSCQYPRSLLQLPDVQ